MKKLDISFVFLLLVSSCATITNIDISDTFPKECYLETPTRNIYYPKEIFNILKENKTNKTEIINNIGEPHYITVRKKNEIWIYITEIKNSNENLREAVVATLIFKKNVLQSVEWDYCFIETRYFLRCKTNLDF